MKQFPDLAFEEAVSDSFAPEPLDRMELPAARKVFWGLGFVVLLIGGLVAGRIWMLGAAKGAAYSVRASLNMSREVVAPANRGVILDRFGETLATNRGAFSLFLDSSAVLGNRSSFDAVMRALSETLGVSVEELKKPVYEADIEREKLVALLRDLTPEEVIQLRGLNLPGVQIEDDYVREYPGGAAFAHLLGYTGSSEKGGVAGKDGVEASYDDRLRGRDGARVFYRDAEGTVFGEKAFFEPKDGQPLTLTIDAALERYFYERFQSGLAALGREAGVGIALNPATGEVLALLSFPSYDNNAFVDRKRNAERAELLRGGRQPLFNRALSGRYNPGSTIKPLLALAALREGLITPETTVFSKGYVEIPNPYYPDKPSRFLDWKAHGLVDLPAALARSSNIYFYALGGGLNAEQTGTQAVRGLGVAALRRYWERFGLGKKTGVDLPAETEGFLPDPDREKKRPWRLGDTYNVSIGQGDLLTTPLQLAVFYGMLANGGRAYRPHVADEEEPPRLIADFSSLTGEIAAVRQGLHDAVYKPYGTASLLYDLPITVAGKTGSAQTHNNQKTNAFFIGYAPEENPEFVLLILIEDAREGSMNTLPIAKDVLRWYYENRLK